MFYGLDWYQGDQLSTVYIVIDQFELSQNGRHPHCKNQRHIWSFLRKLRNQSSQLIGSHKNCTCSGSSSPSQLNPITNCQLKRRFPTRQVPRDKLGRSVSLPIGADAAGLIVMLMLSLDRC